MNERSQGNLRAFEILKKFFVSYLSCYCIMYLFGFFMSSIYRKTYNHIRFMDHSDRQTDKILISKSLYYMFSPVIPYYDERNMFSGCRHMWRFHAKLLYEQPILDGLEYVFRLDDDSFITHPVQYDIVKFMKDKMLWYGYMFKRYDSKACVKGLWKAAGKYIKTHKIKQTFFKKWPENQIFYNNFEISKIDFWRSKEYKNYINYIYRLGGIYYYRWGDAPVKSLGLSLFMPERKLHQFKDIGYKHQVAINKPE